MGHTQPDKLKDLQDVIDQIRSWGNIKEKSPNIFYLKSKPFLHFHDKDGQRWADVRDGETWGKELVIPFNSTLTQRSAFLKEVKRRYEDLKEGK